MIKTQYQIRTHHGNQKPLLDNGSPKCQGAEAIRTKELERKN